MYCMVEERAKRSKADRISQHSRELVRNLQGWVDLRLQLSIVQYLESALRNRKRIGGAIAAGFAFVLAITFLLIAVALWLGLLLGNPIWGFILIGAIMAVATLIFYLLATQSKDIKTNQTKRIISETNGRTEPKSGKQQHS